MEALSLFGCSRGTIPRRKLKNPNPKSMAKTRLKLNPNHASTEPKQHTNASSHGANSLQTDSSPKTYSKTTLPPNSAKTSPHGFSVLFHSLRLLSIPHLHHLQRVLTSLRPLQNHDAQGVPCCYILLVR